MLKCKYVMLEPVVLQRTPKALVDLTMWPAGTLLRCLRDQDDLERPLRHRGPHLILQSTRCSLRFAPCRLACVARCIFVSPR
jgi:hypothetical protein